MTGVAREGDMKTEPCLRASLTQVFTKHGGARVPGAGALHQAPPSESTPSIQEERHTLGDFTGVKRVTENALRVLACKVSKGLHTGSGRTFGRFLIKPTFSLEHF